ncbi:MAG: ROK family protein [Bacteroidota bacterium]
MNSNTIIGVDLGGTKIHSGLIVGGDVLEESKVPTPQNATQEEVLEAIVTAINNVLNDEVEGIGIGLPGVMDLEEGVIINTVNIPSLNGLKITEYLTSVFEVPVFINNDANCFVIGEKYFGHGKEYSDIVAMTLGTGLGGAVVVNNRLYSGKNVAAGEICAIKYKEHDLEHYCSSQFFKKEYNTTGLDLYNKAKEGDAEALRIFKEYGNNLGEAIYTLILVYDPQLIVIGGSIAGGNEFFVDGIHEVLKTFPVQEQIKKLKIAFSNEPKAAVLGAGALVYDGKEEGFNIKH